MKPEDGFSGFPRESLTFFKELAENNHKTWFDQHKNDYERYVLDPAKDFILAMGWKLRAIAPGVHADPRINKSIFRLNRDTRFSHDKSPYKTHLGVWMWEGSGPRMECSGFYFHLEPTSFWLGVGLYMFPKNLIEVYRQAVVDKKRGPALAKAVAKIEKSGPYTLGGRHYKKTPSGYDSQHPQADYLLFNGLYIGLTLDPPAELHHPQLIEFCFEHFKKMLPLHQWLLEAISQI